MTKYRFLNELDQLLSELPEGERREVLEDYEEHFAFAKRAAKSDADVIALVGTPKAIASEILGAKVEVNPSTDSSEMDTPGKEKLEDQAQALEAQAKVLEAKLAAQAQALEAQAEALEAKLAAQEEKSTDVETFVETVAAKAGALAESITGVLVETFETEVKAPLEDAVQSDTLIEEMIDITGVENVIISGRNQKVEIEKTTYPTTARVRLTKGILAVKVEGDTLYVEARELRRKFGIGTFINFDPIPELTVELPESSYHLIQAKTTNAKIEIESFDLAQLDLESANGRLEVCNIRADELKLKTTNGKIEVAKTKAHVDANTMNGKIELKEIDGAVIAHSTNAKIELAKITGHIKARTTNGKIEFRNDTIDQNVNLKTVNAKIDVRLANKPEHAKFELSTTNAKTNLFGTSRNYDVFGDGTFEVKLSTANAKIEVYQELD